MDSSAQPIRVAVADDHAIVREGVRMLLLSRSTEMVLVGEAANSEEAIRLVDDLQPDILLLDMKMPGQDGPSTIKAVHAVSPTTRILVFSSFDDSEMIFTAIQAGAQGYLLKDTLPDRLIKSMLAVFQGETILDDSVARRVVQAVSRSNHTNPTERPLTEREIEVLRLVAQGLSNQQIAIQLTIRDRTVSRHVSNILSKLQLESRTQATLYAIRTGLVDPG